jgi:palmitoyltransferase
MAAYSLVDGEPQQEEREPQQALCCCEYLNSKGEVVHMLQLCCECNELDRLVDAAIRGDVRRDALDDVLTEIDSRLRFPWPFGGGAAHIGLAGLVPPVLLGSGALAASASPFGLALAAIGLPCAAAFAHRRLLRLRKRNGFLFSWTLHAYALCSLRFFTRSAPQGSELANALTVALGLAGALALGQAHKPPNVLPADFDTRARTATRAHRCAVSGLLVERYDHYCAWVDAPIGRGNHRAYLCFVAATAAASACNGAHVAAGALARCGEASSSAGSAKLAMALSRCARLHARTGAGSLDIAICAMMAVTCLAVGALLIGQCLLISQNLTGYEARHIHRIDYLVDGAAGGADDSGLRSRRRSPFDRGLWANWAEFWRSGNSELVTRES